MQITDRQLENFIEIYQKNFGVRLDRESAYRKGVQILQLMKLTYKPVTKNDHAKYRAKV